jgi:aspartate carbamoyltransferase catalytic subunit
MKHILAADQFSRSDLDYYLARSSEMEELLRRGGSQLLHGKILGSLFYEPSTRTRLSFETAMLRLGGNVISETDVTFSSITKGEVIKDTIRIVGGYADVIAIRTKQKGEAKHASHYSPVPILNGGDGAGEHPTQSLLDLYTISKHHKIGQKALTVTFVGDLKYGRTVHSLAQVLHRYDGISINYVAPEAIQIPDEYLRAGDSRFNDLSDEILRSSDVIYDTRMQEERFENPDDFAKVKDSFIFTTELVGKMPAHGILMHPLPRVNEIQQEVDTMPQAKYFEQALNGVPVRMALIADVLGF